MKPLAGLLLIALLAYSDNLPAQAREPSERNWYTVELLIFENTQGAPSVSEQMPLLPGLSYPENARHLSPGETEAPLETSLPESFVLLPGEEREYNSERRRIDRRPDMNVLFHQAWRQPVAGKRDATAILIHSDSDAADYPRLQGAIRLYVSRYLHLESNLWLNTVANELPAGWRMPAPPLPPLPPVPPIPPVQTELPDFKFAATPDGGFADNEVPQPAAADKGVEEEDPEASIEQGRYHPYNHAVLLRQHRRMRSGELHYLDHPGIGLLIKLSSYEFNPSPPLTSETVPAID